ncbi:hypothetical protein [Proteiniclasticum sp.]|uniref:hypothetical protein n=1 Tax=Proteiniclasticum sp. TaxID=2053595 RepID=UPI0028A0585B|nr:hypothetical protein [Proteiniclasticum sp.]
MADSRKKGPDSGGPLDYILEDYKRKEKSYSEENCTTGSDSHNLDEKKFKLERIKRIVSILTSLFLVLGLLVFLFLWLSR